MAAALAQGPGLDWVQSLDGMDNDTASLMINIYLEEIAELQATAGEQGGDDAVAQELFGVALRQYRANRAARTPPQPRPVPPPPRAPAQVLGVPPRRDLVNPAERTPRQPRRVQQAPPTPEQSPLPEQSAVSNPPPAPNSTAATEPHASPEPPAAPKVVRETCTACNDNFNTDELIHTSCGHYYCADDIQQIFGLALENEEYYPPRCCGQPLEFEESREALGEDLAWRFHQKRPELDDKARLYCHDGACSAYIPVQARAEDICQCPACLKFTCGSCKKTVHPDQPCPEDKDAQAILKIAKQEGWQKCNGCGNMVELRTGCNHMTCRCKAQFCYVCGKTWKNCPCPQFDQTRLLERARVVAEREGRGAAAVGDIANNLLQRHECAHARYDKVRVPALTCDGCAQQLATYIFRCTRCRLQMCRRCRFHL